MTRILLLLRLLLVIGLFLLSAFSEASIIAKEDVKEARVRAAREVDLGVAAVDLKVGGILDSSACDPPCTMGENCVYAPKQCFTTPCPQTECVSQQ